jgi:cell division protein FtsQ
LAQAGIREGANVLGVNLTAARSRLLAHPWIAEAEVRREIPATLRIRIREHVPAAVVDVGAKFLLNEQGDVFKEWEASDPAGLPVVRGLAVQDLRVADRSGAASSGAPLAYLKPSPAPAPLLSRAMEAVSQVLALGREPGGVLPARQLAAIRVDPELGLTVEAFEPVKSIRLGYDDYREKYRLLGELKTFLLKQADFNDFERIDLNDVHRVILNPARSVSRLAGR